MQYGNANEIVTITFFHFCYLAIILTRSPSTQTKNYPGTKFRVDVVFKLRKRMKNSSSCVHVLRKTLNWVISRCCFAKDGKEMYQNLKRTCRAIALLTKSFVFWRCCCRRRRVFLRSLMNCSQSTLLHGCQVSVTSTQYFQRYC